MLTAVIGVPSASKASTYHENKDSFKRKDLTFLSKVELRRAYEFIELENFHLKQPSKEVEMLKAEIAQLKANCVYLINQSNGYQEKVLELQDKILNHYGIENKPYMKVAN